MKISGKIRKAFFVVLVSCILAGCLCLKNVAAGQISATSGNHNFSNAWSETKRSGSSYVVYGYNTEMVDEDYAWGYHAQKSHYAALKNGSGWHSGSAKSGGSISKIEASHYNNGSGFVYQVNW